MVVRFGSSSFLDDSSGRESPDVEASRRKGEELVSCRVALPSSPPPMPQESRDSLCSSSIHPFRRLGEREGRSDMSTAVVHLEARKKERNVFSFASLSRVVFF